MIHFVWSLAVNEVDAGRKPQGDTEPAEGIKLKQYPCDSINFQRRSRCRKTKIKKPCVANCLAIKLTAPSICIAQILVPTMHAVNFDEFCLNLSLHGDFEDHQNALVTRPSVNMFKSCKCWKQPSLTQNKRSRFVHVTWRL